MRNRIWVVALPFVALMVGYSRIYLAQHFLTDVTGGTVIGMISSYLSLLIYRYVHERRIAKRSASAHASLPESD
jgi:membrane-associated phospholipid phosphatase